MYGWWCTLAPHAGYGRTCRKAGGLGAMGYVVKRLWCGQGQGRKRKGISRREGGWIRAWKRFYKAAGAVERCWTV
jgi:hypothetical protein